MIIKILFMLASISFSLFLIMGLITRELDKKPKTNKFRQWWSRHIVDLDNSYDD
jgi:hypothetical protein